MRTPLRLLILTLAVFFLLSLLVSRFKTTYPASDLVQRTFIRLQQSRPSWAYGRNSDSDPSYANSKSPAAQKQAELGAGSTFEKDGSAALGGSGRVGNGNSGTDRPSTGYSPDANTGSFSLHEPPLSDADKQSLKDADRGFTSAEQASALKKLEMKYGDKLRLTDSKTSNDGSSYDPLAVYSTDSESAGSSWPNAAAPVPERNGVNAGKAKQYANQHADSVANAAGGRVNNDGTVAPSNGRSSWSVGSGGNLLSDSSSSNSNAGSSSGSSSSNGGAGYSSTSETERDKDRGFTDKEQALALEKLEQQYEQTHHGKPTWREKALAASASASLAAAVAKESPSRSSTRTSQDGFSTSVRKASATEDTYVGPTTTPIKVGSIMDDIDKDEHMLPRVEAWGRKIFRGGLDGWV